MVHKLQLRHYKSFCLVTLTVKLTVKLTQYNLLGQGSAYS